MTIEEAIKVLEIEKESYYGLVEEAICVALAALRAQAEVEKNEPLTLEGLREMDWEPVWLEGTGLNRWDIFACVDIGGVACFVQAALPLSQYGETWLAYRRKPEEAPADG